MWDAILKKYCEFSTVCKRANCARAIGILAARLCDDDRKLGVRASINPPSPKPRQAGQQCKNIRCSNYAEAIQRLIRVRLSAGCLPFRAGFCNWNGRVI